MFRSQEVTFASGSIQLAGTLTEPQAADGERLPAVVLIAGSGRVNRNENNRDIHINALREIAAHLAAHGFASLRYDKRGIGRSQGSYWDAGFFDNVTDAGAAIVFLAANPAIDPRRIFLLGHSEGGMVSVRLAATGAPVAGAILLACPAQSGEQVVLWQTRQALLRVRPWIMRLMDLLGIDMQQRQRKRLEAIKASTRNWYRTPTMQKVNTKWMREFFAYNPADDMAKITVPVLAVTGAKDVQVDPGDLETMARLIHGDFERHEVPNLTHILRVEAGKPGFASYTRQTRKPLDPGTLQLITNWLARHATRSAAATGALLLAAG